MSRRQLISMLTCCLLVLSFFVCATGQGQDKDFDSPSAFDYKKNDDVKHKVPLAEVHQGVRAANPRDMIPPIYKPKYQTVETASWMKDKDRVLVYENETEARAYPTKVLNRHEVVNDSIDDFHFAVVY